MRGLVERTRVAVVEVAGKGGSVTDAQTETETEDEFTNDEGGDEVEDADPMDVDEMHVEGNHGRWEMEVARVYERTIVELGMSLDVSEMDGFG